MSRGDWDAKELMAFTERLSSGHWRSRQLSLPGFEEEAQVVKHIDPCSRLHAWLLFGDLFDD